MTSSTTMIAERLLKQDRLGRVQVPAARRRELLAEYECSGMSGAEFAAYVRVYVVLEPCDMRKGFQV